MTDVKESFCNGVPVVVFIRYRGYDKPLLTDGCCRPLSIWEVTTVAKHDVQGLGERGALND
jgi:hypothetical protein